MMTVACIGTKLNFLSLIHNPSNLKGTYFMTPYIATTKTYLVITDTWLQNLQSDNIWLEQSVLNKDGLQMDVINRSKGRGGGLALISNATLNMKRLMHGSTRSFEYGV